MSKVMATWYINIYPILEDLESDGERFYSDELVYESRGDADKDQSTITPRIACVPVKVVLDSFDGNFIKFVED